MVKIWGAREVYGSMAVLTVFSDRYSDLPFKNREIRFVRLLLPGCSSRAVVQCVLCNVCLSGKKKRNVTVNA